MGTYYDSKNEKAIFYRGTSKDPYHLFVAQITDLLNCENCTEIESIYYSYKLKELPIPFTAMPIDYSKFPNLEELSFGFPVSWDYIASLDIPRIKRLSFCLDNGRVTKKMVFENLIDLDISFSHLYQSKEENEQPTRQRFDFSGVPNIHSIRLKYAEYFDYDSLKNLKELQSLSVQDKTLDELSWLKNVPQLRSIQLLGKLDDLTSIIEYQPRLKRLFVEHNRVTRLMGLLELRSLNYVNAYANPLLDGREFRKAFRGQCYIDEDDRIKDDIRNNVDRLIITALERFESDVPNHSRLRALLPRTFEHYRTMGENKLLEEIVQKLFEADFDKYTSPKWIDGKHYSPDYKEYFLDYAREIYPYIKTTREIRDAISKSHISAIEMYKHNSNHIFFIGDDFYVIEVSIKAGTGRRKLAGVYYVAVQEQILELIDREWNSVIPDYNRLDYDFDVKITGLYGVTGNQRLAFPIMLLMRTILEGRTIKEKTAICEMLDVQDEPIYDTKENALRILRLAELQKIDTIIALTHDEAKVAGCFPIENEKVIICSSFTDAINELSEDDFLKDVGYYV